MFLSTGIALMAFEIIYRSNECFFPEFLSNHISFPRKRYDTLVHLMWGSVCKAANIHFINIPKIITRLKGS